MEYDSYFLLVTKYVLIIGGLWPKVNTYNKIYFVYSFLVQTYFLLFMFTLLVGVILELPALSALQKADILTFVLVYLVGMWKMFLAKTKPIKKLINDVVIFQSSLKGPDTILMKLYKKYSINNFKLVVSLPMLTSTCYLAFLLANLLDYFKWKKLESKGMMVEKHLIFTQWLPNIEKYFDYYYMNQLLSGLIGGLYICIVDSLILSLLNYTFVRLRLLGVEMENLFSRKEVNLAETKAMLRELIIKHENIISHVEEINKIFKWLFFVDFTIKSYHISLILVSFFDESAASIPKAWIFFKITQVGVLFLQAGSLYFQANKITTESEILGTAIYKSEWMGQPIEISRSLLIMMARTKKALQLDSFGMVTLSNSLLLKISQAAYTYIILKLSQFK